MGIKQVYGDGAVQYLRAGKGVLHEEMWELPDFSLGTDLELFQIWVRQPLACLYAASRLACLRADKDRMMARGVAWDR